MLAELARSMAIDPGSIRREAEGDGLTAVIALQDTGIEAKLTLTGSDANLQFNLPPGGEDGLYFAGALNLSLKLDGRQATQGSASFQHYANTNQPSKRYLEDGKTAICGWSYGSVDGGTGISPIEMARADDGVGWRIGSLGDLEPIFLPGGFNLAPYDSWAHMIAIGVQGH